MANNVSLPVVDLKGKEVGSFAAPSVMFGAEPNEAVVHFVCEGQRFRFYKKTATTKTRSAVSGGGKKARKQKGTGGARQGGIRGPHWVGGGVVFGPAGRIREFKVNKKLRQIALASVLSDRHSGGQVKILKADLKDAKTKTMAAFLKNLSVDGARVGFVLSGAKDNSLVLSIRNIRNVDCLTEEKWTPLDMVKTDTLIFSEAAMEGLSSRFNG
jgi:large subunit ribosomal protein L4